MTDSKILSTDAAPDPAARLQQILEKQWYDYNRDDVVWLLDQLTRATATISELSAHHEWHDEAAHMNEEMTRLGIPPSRFGHRFNLLIERLERATATITQLDAVLREYVEWFGAVHGQECPGDDTCACIGGGLNARVNAVLAQRTSGAVRAPEKTNDGLASASASETVTRAHAEGREKEVENTRLAQSGPQDRE